MEQTTKIKSGMPKGMGGMGSNPMRDGMKKHSPSASDASTKPPSGSVNDGAVRTAPAKTHSIGGRVA